MSRPRRSSPITGKKSACARRSKTCPTGCSIRRRTATAGPARSSARKTRRGRMARAFSQQKYSHARRTSCSLENVSGWNDPKKDAILDEMNSIIIPKRVRTAASGILQDVYRRAAAPAAVIFAGNAGREKRTDRNHAASGKRRAEFEHVEYAYCGIRLKIANVQGFRRSSLPDRTL